MNNAPPSLDDLISRHFDEAWCPDDQQRLTEALDSDIQARLDFVAAARLHAGLESLAPPLPPLKKRHLAGWILAGAAAVLMIGGGVYRWNQPLQDKVRITLQGINVVSDGKTEKAKPSRLVKRIVKSPASALPAGAQALDMQDLLSRYYVNVSPDGLTVPEALGQLEDAIKEVNILRRPELNQLTFKAGYANFPQPFDPTMAISAAIPMTVHQYLNFCAKIRQVSQKPSGQQYGVGGFSIQYKGLTPKQEESLKVMSRVDLDLKVGEVKWSVLLRFITLEIAQLPTGFNENTGSIVSEEDFRRFESTLAMKAPLRMTGWLDQQKDRVFSCHLGHIDDVGSIWSDSPDPEWLSVDFDFAAQPTGELICVSGKMHSEGWKVLSPNERALGRKGVSDAEFNTGRVGVCLPTEFEVWVRPKQIALFVLDSPPGSLTTLVGISVVETKVDSKQSNNGSEDQQLTKRLQDVDETRSKALRNGKKMDESGISESRFGITIDGKPGFVLSPWTIENGPIDVSGIPRGTKVKCPYTRKNFLVP